MSKIFLKINFNKIIFLLIFLIKFIFIATNTCKSNNRISITDCFNDIIKFDQDKFSIRLFYGLNKNGRNYFPDNSFIKLINVNCDEEVCSRFESNNIIVKIFNSTINTVKEYILSISSYITVIELYDIETFNFKIMNSIKYLQHQVFSFEFPILEYKNNNEYIYFCVFSHSDNYYDNHGVLKGYEKGEKASIVRFKFKEHKFDVSLVSVALIDNYKFNDRVITAFIIDELNYIGIIFIKGIDNQINLLFAFMTFL